MAATNIGTSINMLEMRCAASGHRLTLLRRQVLTLLLKRGGQASAYEIINDLPSVGRRPSPPTVYRALEFLMRIGIVSRVATTGTFFVSVADGRKQHTILLVCTVCGATELVADAALEHALSKAAGSANYQVDGGQTEVNGICEACMSSRNAPKPSSVSV
jgi:Fur family transcriptional regulator, zinc uptake regulator